MCGIFGAVNTKADSTLLELIQHRGPDAAGFINLGCGLHHIQLGHCRLAIVDLSPSGNQPMMTKCRRHHIVYNGEVYNHLELRGRLCNKSFCGHSDTETILYCMVENGIHSVSSFNGIFAFAYLDMDRSRLYLVRDPFGVKPLYYFQVNNKFGFSSEIKPLIKLIDDTVDLENLAQLLRLRFLPAPDTLFKNIKKLLPGHVLEVDLSKDSLQVRISAFIDKSNLQSVQTFESALVEYEALIESAVKRQLMSDVEVGILLSGGVDSALVAAYAQQNSPYRMKAFTIGFSEQYKEDEINEAAETAKFLGMEHFVARIGFDDFLGALKNCILYVEEPLATTSIIPMFFLSELAGKFVKVVLSGQGADETLGGYRRYRGELFKEMLPLQLSEMLKMISERLRIKNDAIVRGLAAMSEREDIRRFIQAYSVFDEQAIVHLIGNSEYKSHERFSYFFDLLKCKELSRGAKKMMAIELRVNLADDLLLYTDKITMHHSIECRVPMLDADLVRFLESLPLSFLLDPFRSKIIHRQLAMKVLPKRIVNRKKKGFFSPTRKWFEDSNRLRQILLDPNSKFISYFDKKYLENIITEHSSGLNRERHIFLLLSIYFWMAQFL